VTTHDDLLDAALIAAGEPPLRDGVGRFAPRTDPETALARGGDASVREALDRMHRNQVAGLRRIGLARTAAAPATSDKPKAPPDWGGGVRGREIVPAGPSMDDALRALLRSDRY
jgi:hypothetical protein